MGESYEKVLRLKVTTKVKVLVEKSYNKTVIDFNFGRHKDLSTLKSDIHLGLGYPSLVLVQPRKTRPCLTERLLMGRKELNQTNKQNLGLAASVNYHFFG